MIGDDRVSPDWDDFWIDAFTIWGKAAGFIIVVCAALKYLLR